MTSNTKAVIQALAQLAGDDSPHGRHNFINNPAVRSAFTTDEDAATMSQYDLINVALVRIQEYFENFETDDEKVYEIKALRTVEEVYHVSADDAECARVILMNGDLEPVKKELVVHKNDGIKSTFVIESVREIK